MSDKEKDEEKPVVAKTAVDLQRLKLMKLMKNVDKPIILPERPKAKNTPSVPEFVRNVMGSSAGAGSGEFHVYRHLRRKEYARQKFIQEKAHKELLDDEYHQKLEDNKRLAEEATAKRRAKRLKKKQGRKQRKQMKTTKESAITDEKSSKEESSDENEETEATVKTNEINEESMSCSINISKDKNEAKTATEKKLLLDTEENQEHTLETSFEEKPNKNTQCKNDT
ncbi:PRKR-interacting protein 1-like protein [Camponotus floridanus]|uniref:PRKR-interacting protein 1-like protein n=1 Tax=Camponotus floridanus TaxID=104421 RepID=E2AM03_CAMFO|nr:PRKR-interacting protein 1 homolog [Camponotus floridanus]EFN65523.1 PRKR-interacting protein 1-like protein [Camponotus floridanus]